MAGELRIIERESSRSIMAINHWKWRANYSRYFTYPSNFLSSYNNNNNNNNKVSNNSNNNNVDDDVSINSNISISGNNTLDKKLFKPTWLSSVDSFTVTLLPSDRSPQLSVLTVSYLDTVLEEHHVSKLQFAWPQVSCMSGFPTRGSLAVIASYVDSGNEKQKFALRFSTPSDTENFINTMEEVLSNRLPKEPLPVDVLSPISSQSEFIPPYRPDTSSMMSPVYGSSEPNNYRDENQQESEFQTQPQPQDIVIDSESNGTTFPPRFTSLLSSCAAEPEQNPLALALVPVLHECDLQSEIQKYMQDASFLDMVSKVNEVISELGGDYAI